MSDASSLDYAEGGSRVGGARLGRRALGHGGFLIGATLVLVATALAVFAPVLTPYGPYGSDLAHRLLPPFWQSGSHADHLLGTDQLGRDYLTRLIYGSRVSLIVGITTVLIAGTIGTTLGIVSGYVGGRVEMGIMFVITTRLAMPIILVALAVVNVSGSSLEIVCLILGLLLWDRFAVVARTATQQIRGLDYVTAARACGLSHTRIMLKHILPNIINPLVVVATLEMAHAILLEAALSFLGLGVPPPLPSWGLMVSEGKEYMFFTPWIITIPGIALLLLVLGINLLGDGLRDVLAPRSRG